MASVDLAKMLDVDPDTKVSVYEIAEKQHISTAYLEQIFSKLRQAGVLSSTKGPQGGYLFAKKINEIKLIEIINAVEEKIQMTKCEECRSTNRIKDNSKCDTHKLWKALDNQIGSFFEKVTLEDVILNRFEC